MKRFFVSCLIIVLVLVFLVTTYTSVYARTAIEDTRNSVIRVIVVEAGKFELLSAGTGFVIGEKEPFEYIATCAHVVSDPAWGEVDIFIWRSRDDLIPVSVHVLLPNADMALLRLDPQHLLYDYEPLELGRRDLVSIGDPVYAIGYPAAADWGLSDYPAAYPEDATVTAGVISRFSTFEGAGFIQMDASVSWGSSGGPLVNQDGQVIGIVSRGAILEGINGAVQIEYLTDILRSRGIAYKPATEVIEEEPIEQPVVEPEVETNIIFYAIGIVVLIALLAVVLISRRQKQKIESKKSAGAVTTPLQSKEPAVTQAKRPQIRPLLKGISGTFAGQKFEFADNQIIIGRDPRLAQLIYPTDKEVISRKHCVVRYDELTQKFVLTDSSSNGTYLSSNQRLDPDVTYHLNSGDRFYLAEPNEVFEVKLGS